MLKQLAKSKGIPTAKFSVLEFPLATDVPSAIGKIIEDIGVFPLFRKPISGCGGGGGGRIESEDELREWVEDEQRSGSGVVILRTKQCLQTVTA